MKINEQQFDTLRSSPGAEKVISARADGGKHLMVIIEGHADQHEREFAFQVFAGTLEHNIAQDYYDDVVDAFLRANALREALGITDPLAIFE